MLRNKNLIPLSHQHPHALALCVRVERAGPIAQKDLAAWRAEFLQLVDGEIRIHFAAEEETVFPAASKFPDIVPLVEELIADHTNLRQQFARATAQDSTSAEISALGRDLAAHIRKEERQLFEGMQQRMTAEDLSILGAKLEEALKQSEQSCILQTEATRLRPIKN